jgi:hypothetical protein
MRAIAPKKEMFQAESIDLSPVPGMRVPSVTLIVVLPDDEDAVAGDGDGVLRLPNLRKSLTMRLL